MDLQAQDDDVYSYSMPLLVIVYFLGWLSSGSSLGTYDEVAEDEDLGLSCVSGLGWAVPHKREAC